MKKVLVYPCGTEIGLEIFKAVNLSTHFELWGGSCSYDHGQFVYDKHIENLPFISDDSGEDDVVEFNNSIKKYGFDYIYPATDSVISVFSKYRKLLNAQIVAPEFETSEICRSKDATYRLLNSVIKTPKAYNIPEEVDSFPVFIKPDKGQGSVGAKKINNKSELIQALVEANKKMLILEYLPGNEYTIDCFTNNEGDLVFSQPRGRKRIKCGISVNTYKEDNSRFDEIAKKINSKLKQRGAWFFQVKENSENELVLLEVAARIAGTSAITRAYGVNLPLMTLHLFEGQKINDYIYKDIKVELDRAFENKYRIKCDYDVIYFDYDDTIICNEKINLKAIELAFKALNNGKKIKLITRHSGDIQKSLKKYRIVELFDEVIQIKDSQEKYTYMKEKNAIFVDDSYNERLKVKKHCGYSVFSPAEIECLLYREE